MIQLASVSKYYDANGKGRIGALSAVDLTINRGDFIVVIGASGSGKSTLLFTIGGMLSPTEGVVSFDGNDIYALSQGERAQFRKTGIGFIFQTFNLVPYLTCLENVALAAIIDGKPKARAFSRAEEMLKRMDLGSRLTHTPSKMSVGERQRVAIARSMINEPDVILADEPTGNLDPATTREVINIFKELNDKGQTIVLVTHDHSLIKEGNRVIRIEKGLIEEEKPLLGEWVQAS